jgi:hypothetical protein
VISGRTAAVARVAVTGALSAVLLLAPGGEPARAAVRYGKPDMVCSVTDSRLREISGLVQTGRGVMFAINDGPPALIYRLNDRCRLVSTLSLLAPVRDTEDLAIGPDGSLWVGDIGGNTFSRTAVSLYQRHPLGGVDRYDLTYPDGAHDAEALLISRHGQVVLVTKVGTGQSRIYSARLPLPPTSAWTPAGVIDIAALRPGGTGSLCVTGGGVSRDGRHFALRTYTTAYEWDAPDGDVLTALRTGVPRPIALAPTAQGESITYAVDGSELLTSTERLPAPVHAITIAR